MNEISRLEHARSLRRMLAASTLSGAYAPIAALGSTIYTGLALFMGLGSAQIAFMFTAVAAAGLVYMVSQAIVSRVTHQKRFLIGCGVVEVLLACAPPVIVVLVPGNQGRFISLLVLAVVASSLANLRSPLHTSWLSHFLPEPIRARFIGRQSIFATVASMVVGFAVGRFVDTTGRTMVSFAVPYAVALVFGLGVYAIQSRLPFPEKIKVQPGSPISATILAPLRNRPFRALLLFNLSLALGDNIFGPFSGYYVLREIGQTYSYIAIQGIVASVLSILSFGLWGTIIAKVGGRRIIPLTLMARMLVDLLVLFLTPSNYVWLHMTAAAVSALSSPGLSIAVTTLQYSIIPESGERSAHFACWAFTHSLLAVVVTAAVSALAGRISDFSIVVGDVSASYIRLFILAKILLVTGSLVMVRRIRQGAEAAEPLPFLQFFAGNPITFTYHSVLFNLARSAEARARTVRALGASRSPLAIATLVRALRDSDPRVREHAVRGLGDSGLADAVRPLAEELADTQSLNRAEAATSLGRLRRTTGIGPLVAALDSLDLTVRRSAINGLAEIGGEEVRARLRESLASNTERSLVPVYVDALSRLGESDIITTALRSLRDFPAPVIRLQLMNSVCRVLGAERSFYALLALEEIELADRLFAIQRKCRKAARAMPAVGASAPAGRASGGELTSLFDDLSAALERGDYARLPRIAADMAGAVASADDPVSLTLTEYLAAFDEGHGERPEVFVMVCLERLFERPGRQGAPRPTPPPRTDSTPEP